MLHIQFVMGRRDDGIGCILKFIENPLDDLKEQRRNRVWGGSNGEFLISVSHEVQHSSGNLVGDILQHVLIVFLIGYLGRKHLNTDNQTLLSVMGNLKVREAGTVTEIDDTAN